MLAFEADPINDICRKHRHGLPGSTVCTTHPGAWGCQSIASNFQFLIGWGFRLLGKQVRTPGRYGNVNQNIGESIHPIARLCKTNASRTPYPLREFNLASRTGPTRHLWRKSSNISIPEFVVQNKRMVTVAFGGAGGATPAYQVVQGLSQRLCQGPLLNALPR